MSPRYIYQVFASVTFLFLSMSTQVVGAPQSSTAASTQHMKFEDITVTYLEGEDAQLKVQRRGKTLLSLKEYRISIALLGYCQFVGDARPQPYLVVLTHGGGAHGPSTLRGFLLKPTFQKVFDVTVDGSIALVKEDPLTHFLVEMSDPAFLYWHSSYAFSAFVPLRLKPGATETGLEISTAHMPQFPQESVVLALAHRFKADETLWHDPEVYPGKVVEQVALLTYANKPALAERFLEEAWPHSHPGKAQFKKEFVELMDKNTYWQVLKRKGYMLPFTVK